MNRPVVTTTPQWNPTYFAWLLAAAVLIVAFLGLLGVIPPDPKFVWFCILALAIAVFVP